MEPMRRSSDGMTFQRPRKLAWLPKNTPACFLCAFRKASRANPTCGIHQSPLANRARMVRRLRSAVFVSEGKDVGVSGDTKDVPLSPDADERQRRGVCT
jgi:hypothetical protein